MRGVRCPLCDVAMREVDRRGVLIDVCPECRGVWLDRGELNKLLEQADALEEPGYDRYEPEDRHRPYRFDDDHPHQAPGRPPKRRKSLWKEFFDFDFDFFD